MCLHLYLASPRPLVGAPPSPLQISLAAPAAAARLRGTFSQPHLSLVTVDGCSCAFPSIAGGPTEYFDGLLGDDAERALGAACVRALLDLAGRALAHGDAVELLPVWIGQEADGVRGRVEAGIDSVDPERFCFAESHLYVLRP